MSVKAGHGDLFKGQKDLEDLEDLPLQGIHYQLYYRIYGSDL